MSALSGLFKKASDAINNFRGNNNFFLGKDGDIVFSKNNVCVHDVRLDGNATGADGVIHTPGYLTIHCQHDEQIGVTLILQWLPNTTLHKNPASIRSVSPRGHSHGFVDKKDPSNQADITNHCESTDEQSMSSDLFTTDEDLSGSTSAVSPDICVEMEGDMITVTQIQERPTMFLSVNKSSTPVMKVPTGLDGGLGVPQINVIPNTPIDHHSMNGDETLEIKAPDSHSQSSMSTSGADDLSDRDEEMHSSSCDDSDGDHQEKGRPANILARYRESCASLLETTPEQFAIQHDLMLTETKDKDESIAIARGRALYTNKGGKASLFSVNLGKMRSMRLFYSNPECTSGQMVIASNDSHYKILRFHHEGMDKLAQLFEQWSAIKTKSVKDGSPSAIPDRHLIICQPAVSKSELDPEDGLYDKVSWDFWKIYKNSEGAIEDSTTIRKAIFFASMEPSLRKEIWPFLLRVYSWQSTLEQRDTIRNDLFLDYQNIRRKRFKKSQSTMKSQWHTIENTITKDVVRTDRKNPFYAGEDNPNLESMKDILLNYAAAYPDINYIQGMSDLLAPLLSTIRDESDTYWCFSGLMQQTVFASSPKGNENLMELNLEYLRELLKLLEPDFFNYLASQKGDTLQLMFVHRWILLLFKREFPEADALHIWEACWARYRTNYFHLFVCVAIVSVYGKDVMVQRLPHDEILLYFSNLAMHMDANIILSKARGLLHEFSRREKIPCTLAGLCAAELEQWDSHRQTQQFHCTQIHGNHEPCPFTS